MRHDPEHGTVSTGGIDVRLEDPLKYALAIGAALVLLLPAARGFSETLGWLPLWLLGMPGAALWALKGFPLPGRAAGDIAAMPALSRRRSGAQARRRTRSMPRRVLSRAA